MPVKVVNSRFINNTGGGLRLTSYGVSSKITNCAFVFNSTEGTGGAISINGSAAITNCTIVGNNAVLGGGAISFDNNAGEKTIINSIIWQNNAAVAAPAADEIDTRQLKSGSVHQGKPTISYSIIENGLKPGATRGSNALNPALGTDGGNNLYVDPKFVTAPTTPGVAFDLNLTAVGKAKAKSKALDAGDNSANSESTDRAGNPRVVKKTAKTPATIDIGAYEAQ